MPTLLFGNQQQKPCQTHRARQGYGFYILRELKEQGIVDVSYTAQSLYSTEDGEEKASNWWKNLRRVNNRKRGTRLPITTLKCARECLDGRATAFTSVLPSPFKED